MVSYSIPTSKRAHNVSDSVREAGCIYDTPRARYRLAAKACDGVGFQPRTRSTVMLHPLCVPASWCPTRVQPAQCAVIRLHGVATG
jgi:hypothetical protein